MATNHIASIGASFPGPGNMALVMVEINGVYQMVVRFSSTIIQYPSDGSSIAYNPATDFPIISPYGAVGKLVTVTGADVNAAPKIACFTVPTASECVITNVVFRNASVSLTTAQVKAGFNAAADDVRNAALALSPLNAATKQMFLTPDQGAVRGTAAQVFGVIPSTLQGGAATVTIDVFGYLISTP